MQNSGGGSPDIYSGEHDEIAAVLKEVDILQRDTPGFADRIAKIRLSHHEDRNKET